MKAAKTVEQASRKSWLASVGACSETMEKSTDTLDKFYVDSNALIQDLISRGESVEAQLKAKLKNKLKGKVMFEDKIAMLKAKFGLQSDSRDIQLEKLSTKVDNLIEVVAKLAQQKAAEKSTAKPETNTTTAKAPVKAAAKTASASSAKSTAKKPAAAKKATTSKAPATPRTRKPAAKKPAASKD